MIRIHGACAAAIVALSGAFVADSEVLEKKEASNVKTQPINKEMPGFSLKYNPSELSDNDTAIKLVSDVLKRLEKQKSLDD